MKLTIQGSVFVAECTFDERSIPKTAGFYWHGGNCRPSCKACASGCGKVWFTPWPEKAQALRKYADKAAAAILDARTASVEASRATDAQIDIPVPEGLAYLPFQRAGIAFAAARPGVLIADEMGLGKTIQALGIVNADPTIKSVLVVCPASLKLNWAREAGKWLVRQAKILVAESADDVRTGDVVIVNYDRLIPRKGKASEIFEAAMQRNWDCFIADEAHYCKNTKSKRAVAVLGKFAKKPEDVVPGLVSHARRRCILTGTPILNKPIEAQPLLAAVAPTEFGNFWGYAKRYCNAHQDSVPGAGMVWNLDGASNLGELQERARASCMVRRLKADVLTELPPKRRQIVTLDPDEYTGVKRALAAEAKAWGAREDTIAELQAKADLAHASGNADAYRAAAAKLAEATRLAFCEIAKARHDTGVAKVPAVIEHVTAMLEEGVEKVLVFGHHHDVLNPIAEHFAESAIVITGETPVEQRQGLVDRFQTDPSVKVAVLSIAAAGVGLTLTAAAHEVFAELDWVPANVSQAEDRAHRIGQKQSVLIQHLVFDGSLDARMVHALLDKQAIADAALDIEPEPVVPASAIDAAERRAGEAKKAAEAQPPRPRKYPVPTEEQRSFALDCLRQLAGACDGAVTEDGAGFAKFDVTIGHELAGMARLTDGQTWLAAKLCRKYRRQLGGEAAVASLMPLLAAKQ